MIKCMWWINDVLSGLRIKKIFMYYCENIVEIWSIKDIICWRLVVKNIKLKIKK